MVSVRAVVAHDELHRDGCSLVLVGGRVHPVSELGTLLRELAAGPVTVEELSRGLEETFGTPPEGAAQAFTRVLQGMIAISRARFPKGVAGSHLDGLARQHLWLAGQDYDHGTGHGVGVALSVHEGPQRLSRLSDVALEPGMILSNEPGHYREGVWGIRIENLLVVEDAQEVPGGDPGRRFMGFRTLTWVPIDRRLIVPAMLSEGEREWCDAYHAGVWERIGPRVEGAARFWLQAACQPL